MANQTTTPDTDSGQAVGLLLGGTKGKLVRFSYLNVFEPRLNRESGESNYSVALLIPKSNTEDIQALRETIKSLQAATWLSQGKKLPPKFWNPLRDGDTDTKQDGSDFSAEYQGHMVLNAKSSADYPPNVVGTGKTADGKFIPLTKRDVKSGDWGRVKVRLYAFTKGTGGVGVGMSSLQLVEQGEPLAGGSSAENDFKDFEDEDGDSSMLA
jgi:hypothetical protein